MKDTKLAARTFVYVLVSFAAIAIAGRGALAQTVINAADSGGGGNWNTSTTWNCPSGPSPCIPNDNSSYIFNVAINTGTVILNTPSSTQAFVIESLNVATGATLTATGGSLLTLNGTLTSSGTLNIGDSGITSPTALIAAGFSNTGTVNITGTLTVQASLQLTGAASANPFLPTTGALSAGTYNLTNDAVIEYSGPGITGIGSGVTVHLNGAGASFDATGLAADNASTANTNSALDTLAANTGTLDLENGASVVTNSGLSLVNTGTIDVDQNTQTSSGGSTLAVGGLLTNNGQITIGNGQHLTSAVAASVGGLLDNTGTVNVHGDITGATPVSASLTVAGAAFSAGIPTQAFTTVNSGTVNLASDASVSVAGTYENLATTNVDTTADYNSTTGKSDSGGSMLAVTGVLSNSGYQLSIGPATLNLGGSNATLNLGNANLTSPTQITAAGLDNLGTVDITGSQGVQALLDLTGPASANPFVQSPAIINAGSYNLTNDAVLEYVGPGISGIGAGVTVNLNGAGASIEATSLTPNNAATTNTNSALDTLAGNAGTLELSNAASVVTNPGLDLVNNATLDVDQSSTGGSYLGVGGTLENSHGATLDIGNPLITKPATATAGGFSNYGTVNLIGTPTTEALLNLTGAASASPFIPPSGVLGSGLYNLTNEAVLEYAGAGISEIGPGTTVNLSGTGASLTATGLAPDAASGTNSALDTLTANAGTFELSNGGSVSTNAGLGLINSGVLDLDSSGQGGSTVNFGGALTNAFGAEIVIGNTNDTKPTTVTVNGPLNDYGGSAAPSLLALTGAPAVQTTLNVIGAAPNTLTGDYSLSGDALLAYGSGEITAIAGTSDVYASTLILVGPSARIGLAGNTSTNSALAGLSMNDGALTLDAGAQVTTNAGVNFLNSGNVSVDSQPGQPGGSALNIGGTIQGTGGATIAVGNGNMASSSKVTADGFALKILSGTLTLAGENPASGSATAALVLNNGITDISYQSSLTLANANSYVALSGISTLSNSGLSALASNEGTLTLEGGAQVTTNPGVDFNNDAGENTLTVDASALTSGVTRLAIGGVLSNSATIDISDSGTSGSSVASLTASGLTNTGTIRLSGATSGHTATLTVNGSAVNDGTIDIGSNTSLDSDNYATVDVTGGNSYTQAAGINGTSVVNGTLTAGSVDVAGGLLQGGGTIDSAVVNAAAVEGGLTGLPGGLAISGNYTQAASGILYQTINGISSGQFSSLNVSGQATAGGLLAITSGYGFSFAAGQTFDILNITSTSGAISGAFGGLEYNGLLSSGSELNIGNGLALQLNYNSNDVVLSVAAYAAPSSADIWNTGAGTWSSSNTSDWASGAVPSSASDVILGSSTGGTVTLDSSVSPASLNSLTVTNGYTLSYGAANESLATNTAVNIDAGGGIDIANSGDTLTTGQTGGNGNLTSFGTLTLAEGATVTVAGALENFGELSATSGAALDVTGDFINGSPLAHLYQTGPTAPTASFEGAGLSSVAGNLTNNSGASFNVDDQYQVTGYTGSGQAITAGGGTTLKVAGTLSNAGNLTIGSNYIASPVAVDVGNLIDTGNLTISGASTQFSFAPAPANVASAVNVSGTWIPSTGILASGLYQLTGDAQLNYSGPGISSIGSLAEVFLTSPNASVNDSGQSANSTGVNNAFDTLSALSGRLVLDSGAQLETSPGVGLTDNGSLEVDTGYQGGSTLSIGGTLAIERGDMLIGTDTSGGQSNLTSPATVNVAGLYNNGEILLTACASAGCAGTATLNVTGPSDAFIPVSGALDQGTYSLSGNAAINYAGPGISSIANGVFVELYGPGASLTDSTLAPDNASTNSALDPLASNAGMLTVNEGASVQTNPGLDLTNTGYLSVADSTSQSPSTLTVGGTLINSGLTAVQAGTSSATLNAAGFSNSGTVDLLGTETTQALLHVTAAGSANSFVSTSGVLSPGVYNISYDAALEYTGPGIASIANGATVNILGPFGASLTDTSLSALTSSGVNSALNTLSSNAGTLILNQSEASATGGLINSGSIQVQSGEDSVPIPTGGFQYVYAPGSLTVAGTLTNTSGGGGCSALCVSGGATVSAATLLNSGAIEVAGYSNVPAVTRSTLAVSGAATNSGTIEVGSPTGGGGDFTAGGTFTNTGTGVLTLTEGTSSYNGTSYTPVDTSASAAGFDNAGTVSISAGNGSLSPAAALTVTGSGNSYTQTGSLALTTVGGTLNAPTVTLQGGVLQGNGTINGNVTNAAAMMAMNSAYPYYTTPAVLTVNGNYSQTSAGVLDELVQGAVTRGTQYNGIDVSGSVTLAGTLDVTTLNGFTLAANQSYDVMNFTPGDLTGSFGTLEYGNLATSGSGTNLLNLGNQLALSVNYDNSTGEVLLDVVTAQPAPTSDSWIGNTDNWSNPSNWSTGETPLPTQNVSVGTGSGGTVTYNDVASTVNSLTVEYGSGNSGEYTLAFGSGDTLNVTKTVAMSAGVMDLMASGAALTTGGTFTNSGGGLFVANGGAVTVGAQSAPADFINHGDLYVDAGCPNGCPAGFATTGGGVLTISGTLTNSGDFRIGNDGSPGGITTESIVSAQSLSTTSGTTTLANTLGGGVLITGENPAFGTAPAVLQLGASITSIQGFLTLVNANSFITTDTSGPYTNDGISNLASIDAGGSLSLNAGASATIGTTLANAGNIGLDTQFNNGSTSGSYISSLPTTLNVAGLSNSGTIGLTGCLTSGCTVQALLNVTGPSGSFIPASGNLSAGNYQLGGNAEIEYNGPGISSVGPGVYLALAGDNGALPSIEVANNGSTTSAFNTLTSNAGNLTFAGGVSVATNFGLTNTGIINFSPGTTQPAASFTVGGTLVNEAGNPQNGSFAFTVENGSLSASGLNNSGALQAYGTGTTLAINGVAENSGLLSIGGTATISGALTNDAGGQLGIGGYMIQGTLEGTGAGNLAAAGLNNSGAVLIYANSSSFGTNNASTVTVTGSGNSYNQTGSAASTLVVGGLVSPAVNVNGGVLEGTGMVTGNVTNAAAIAGGTSASSPGLLTISGSYTQTSAGTLDETVAGSSTRGTQYSAVNVSGAATLDGTLNVSAVSGFAFAPNESFDIMNFAPNSLSGSFATLQYGSQTTAGSGLLDLGGNAALALAYNGSGGQVLLDVVTPDNWSSNTVGAWSTASNWSIGLPGPTQRVVIGFGSGGMVTLDQSASIYDLTVQAANVGAGIYADKYALVVGPSETLTTAGGVTIGAGGEIDISAAGSVLNSGGDVTIAGGTQTPVGLAGPGVLNLESGGTVNVGTTSEPRALDNAGTLLVDSQSSGGSSLNISGALSSAGGQITIGNSGITAPALLSAGGFAGNALTGTVQVVGSDSVGGAAATLELANGIASIAANSSLLLLNSNSEVDLAGATGSNSALTSLAGVAGALQLESGSGVSTNGSLTINGGGSVGVDDTSFTAGGSSLTVNGTLNNAGTFALGGGGGSAIVSDAFAAALNNSGTVTIGGGSANAATLSVTGPATNSGTITIAGGAEINVTGSNSYAQTGGATTVNGTLIASNVTLNGGTITADGDLGAPVTINGGTLKGAGYIGANVSNVVGMLEASPGGFYSGTLTINGSYSQSAGGTLDALLNGPYDVAAPFPWTNGVLDVVGTGSSVTLAGALDILSVDPTAGGVPVNLTAGQTFDIINAPANELFGTFSTLEYECTSGQACGTSTTGGLLTINENGTEIGILPEYETSLGEVVLDIITPPPTAVGWQGGSGNWSDTADWSNSGNGGFTPMNYQDVTLGSGAGGTVTYDETNASINSLTVGTGTSSGYTLSLNPSTTLNVATTVAINSGGEIDVAASGAALAANGNLTNSGTLNVANGGSLTVGSLTTQPNFTNSPSGTLNVDAKNSSGGSGVVIFGTLANGGALNIGNGNLTTPTTVNVGTLQNAGLLNMSGASTTNTATVNVVGNAANILTVNVGTFTSLTVTGSTNSYTQSCPGSLCLASTTVNGSLTAPAVNNDGGVIQGTGAINGAVTNSAIVAGGAYLGSPAPGTLTINGSYTQTSAGTLQEDIAPAGTSGTNVSALNVIGSVSLDGSLQIDTLSGFTLAAGQTFDIMNFTPSELAGEFATIQYDSFSGSGNGVVGIGGNLDVSLNYDNAGGDLVLQVGALDTWNGTTDVWTGANDGSNWSTGALPTATEDVLIGGGEGGTVTYNETQAGYAVESLTVQPGTSSGYALLFDPGAALAVTNALSIDKGGEIAVEANGASLAAAGSFSNAGTLTLGQDTQSGEGGPTGQGGTVTVGSASAPTSFTNKGTINIDPASTASPALPTGGSTLSIAGTLNNSGGTINIGNTGISSQSLVSAASLSATSGTKTLSNTLDGTVLITGEDPSKGTSEAVLEAGAGITSIAKTGSLTLANSNSFITTESSALFTNDGLSALGKNAGSLTLEDGASATLTASAVANSGTILLDGGAKLAFGAAPTLTNVVNSGTITVGNNAGGSALTVNGLLDNSMGTVSIGNVGITSSDTMSIQSFASVGVNGAESPSTTLNGNVDIAGSSTGTETATLNLDSGITDIGSGSSLALFNANAHVDLSTGTASNSGLSSLANVHGSLSLENGAFLTTSGDLAVASGGTINVDDFLSNGGSNVSVGGTLDNSGSLDFGMSGSAPATVSAAGLTNSGTATLGGSNAGTATLTVSGNATNSGAITIQSGSQIQVSGGNSFTQSGGSTTIAGNGGLSAASFTQTGGTTIVDGTLTAPTSGVTLEGGTLEGAGAAPTDEIAANVSNASGTVVASADGANPGTLAINGTYSQASQGTLDEFIGGTSNFSVINLTGGTLTLGGTLDVSTVGGFALASGQSFDIINFPAGSLSGTFGTLAYGGVTGSGTSPLDIENGTLALSVQYGGSGNNEVILNVTGVATSDVWKANSGDWYDSGKDATDWSTQSPPAQPSLSPPQSPQDVIIGEGSTGGTVTLCDESTGCASNPNVTEVKSLTVEANPNQSGANYVLSIDGGVTLTVDKHTSINPGGEIDLTAGGATLNSAGSMSNGGTLTLANGASVTVGTSSAPANFTNSAGGSAGIVNVDTTGSGGSTLTVNGALTNDINGALGTINIGNSGLTANATVIAQGTGSLDGTLDITGPDTGTPTETLTLLGTTPDTVGVKIAAPAGSHAALSLGTTPVSSILSTGSLTLSGSSAFVETSGGPNGNSALTGLTSNAGKLELDGGAQVITGVDSSGNPTAATFSNTGSVVTGKSTTFSSNGNLIVAGTGGLSNSGTITVDGDSAVQVLNGSFVQSGSGTTTTVTGKGARLQVLAVGASYTDSTDLNTSGTVGMDIQADTTLSIESGGIACVGSSSSSCNGVLPLGSPQFNRDLTNEGAIAIQSGGKLEVSGNAYDGGAIAIQSGGELDVSGNAYDSSTGTVTNDGTLMVDGTMQTSGTVFDSGKIDPTTYTQSGGTTDLAGGSVISPTVDLQGGSLTGNGTIQGNLVNDALVNPGLSNTTLTVDGNYTQGQDGTLLIGISSLTDFSSLDITGNATLDGAVEFDFLNGYVPQANDTFAFLDATSVTGDFSSFDLVGITCASCTAGFNGTNFTFSLDMGGTPPTSVSTPEPATLLLLITGLLAMTWVRRRKCSRTAADAGLSGS